MKEMLLALSLSKHHIKERIDSTDIVNILLESIYPDKILHDSCETEQDTQRE